MFPKELSKQRERFMVMLATMLDCLRDPERFAADCRALGERHEGYGVQEEHYPLVQAALRDALLEHVPDRMSESDVELWQRLFEAIGAQMRLA